MPRLCLNMIVKNESKIIERLLATVLPIIDSYCICDTGSTDNTKEVIETFMKSHNIPGEVYEEPFKNFGYNRDHALRRADKWGDYVLLLDADMKLVIDPSFDKNTLTADSYQFIQKNQSIQYYNTRIIKTNIGARCVCPTHEYYQLPPNSAQLKLDSLHINDIGDGGCKTNKFERDIKLLLEGLKDEPNNQRYHFYLANSYRDIGRSREAIEYYKKRVELGGWIEEVFISCTELGKLYRKLNDIPNAIFWWLEAYNRHPKRAESLYHLTKYYREAGKQQIGQAICDLARSIPFPKDDVLFIETPVYDFLLFYEHSILTYYTRKEIDHKEYLKLIGKNYDRDNVLNNYKFYVEILSKYDGAVARKESCIETDCLVPPVYFSGDVPDYVRHLKCDLTPVTSDGLNVYLCYIDHKTRYYMLVYTNTTSSAFVRSTNLFKFNTLENEIATHFSTNDDNGYTIRFKVNNVTHVIDFPKTHRLLNNTC